MPKIIASLFSGCGGLELGFTGGFNFRGHEYNRLDTDIVFANDFDRDACACYNSNNLLVGDGVQCRLEDIREFAKAVVDNKKEFIQYIKYIV